MDTLFLAWQHPEKRRWFTVGRLDRNDGQYHFGYTKGAEEATRHGFEPLTSFPELQHIYESKEVFPLFANRVLSKNRPEYPDFVEWLSLSHNDLDPVAMLARTGGSSMTDTLEIFPYPQLNEHKQYRLHFFVRGSRHQSNCAQKRIATLKREEHLCLMRDIQNTFDSQALMVRTAEQFPGDMHLLGYLPRYLATELSSFDQQALSDIIVKVVRVNPPPAPIHFRLLCCLTMRFSANYRPFSSAQYQLLNS